MHHPTDRITHITAFVTPVVEHWLERERRSEVINVNSNLFEERKEGNVFVNDALNTFYLLLYDVRYMVKDHSDSERGNPLPPQGLLFPN